MLTLFCYSTLVCDVVLHFVLDYCCCLPVTSVRLFRTGHFVWCVIVCFVY